MVELVVQNKRKRPWFQKCIHCIRLLMHNLHIKSYGKLAYIVDLCYDFHIMPFDTVSRNSSMFHKYQYTL